MEAGIVTAIKEEITKESDIDDPFKDLANDHQQYASIKLDFGNHKLKLCKNFCNYITGPDVHILVCVHVPWMNLHRGTNL